MDKTARIAERYDLLLQEMHKMFREEQKPVHVWVTRGEGWALHTMPEAEGRPADFVYDGTVEPHAGLFRLAGSQS